MINQNVKDDEIDLRQLFGVLLGGRWLILGSVLVAACIAFVYLMVAKPVYEANALIQVEDKQGGLAGFGDLESLFGSESSGASEIEVLKSRLVLGPVVNQELLHVVVSPSYFPLLGRVFADNFSSRDAKVNPPFFGLSRYNTGGQSLVFDSFYIADSYAPITIKLVAGEFGKFTLYDIEGVLLGAGSEGEVVSLFDRNVVFKVGDIKANLGAEFYVSVNRNIDAINGLRSNLIVSERGRDSGIIALSMQGVRRSQIKGVLNSVVKSYQDQNVKRLSEEAERSINFLGVQIPSIRGELEIAEQALNDYRAKNSSLDIGLEAKAALDRLIKIEGQLNQLELKESDISSRYKKDHPLYSSLLEQRASLQRERERVDDEVSSLPSTQQDLLRLMRNVEVTNEIYLQLLGKMEELKVVRASTVGNVRTLDDAEVQTFAIAPKKKVIMLLAIFVGGVIGMVIVFSRSLLNSALRNPSEIQEKLGIANYGVVPRSQTQADLSDGSDTDFVSMLAVGNPKDLSLEAIRSIRTSLHFAMMEADDNVVMITGPSPGIGKSFTSTNLSALIGQSGQKVLLIDADLRRGHINKTMGVNRQPGLSNLLSEGFSLDDIIHSGLTQNLDFIATGAIPPNPSELLMSSRFSEFLEKVKNLYDIVLIDTPPTLAVTDAMIVGKQVGTTMAIVRHDVTTLREIEQMRDQAEEVGIKIKGYIYNFMEYDMTSYYGQRYYNYGYYGMDEDESGTKL